MTISPINEALASAPKHNHTILSYPLCVQQSLWPKASNELVFIWEAINSVGNALYENDWTGGELSVLTWPESPEFVAKKAATSNKEKLAKISVGRLSPTMKRRQKGSVSQISAILKEPKSHVFDWHKALAQRKLDDLQKRWSNNQSAIVRLSKAAEWLADKCRNGNITTSYIWENGKIPFQLEAHYWNCQSALTDIISEAGFKHYNVGLRKSFPITLFLDRSSLEAEILKMTKAPLIITAQDTSELSPYLRYAIKIALSEGFAGGNATNYTRESLELALKDNWSDNEMGCTLSAKMAERLSFIIRHP